MVKRIAIYLEAFKGLFASQPLIIRSNKNFFKLTLRASVAKQLKREVTNSNNVQNGSIYCDMVIPLKQRTPFAVTSRFITEDSYSSPAAETSQKLYLLTEVAFENATIVWRAPKKPAINILQSQIQKLAITDNRPDLAGVDLYSIIDTDYFKFKIPVTPMHGDYVTRNALVQGGKLYLVDWEYAMQQGSILYDWWFLKNHIEKHKIENNLDLFLVMIRDTLDKTGVTVDQFNAFGCAMNAIINLSRIRAGRHLVHSTAKYNLSIDKLQKLA